MSPGLLTNNGDSPVLRNQPEADEPTQSVPELIIVDLNERRGEPSALNGYSNSDEHHRNGMEFSQANGQSGQSNNHEHHLNSHTHNEEHHYNEHVTNGSSPIDSGFAGLGTPSVSSEEPEANGPLADAPPNASMPIAVIGIAVRAGSAATPDEFFEMLSRGRSAFSSTIPTGRFNNASFYHPNAGKLGCINTNGASFITQDVTKFDAPFFSLTELEATSMDPQQRLLLECAFEALENAGIQKHATVGKDIGVFMGAGSPEYEFDLFRDSDTMPMFQATGNHLAMQSNRISHFFDWRGPSVTMDTACSSSLTAVHFACQSIRNRESSVALVGGCNLNLIPEFFINYSTSRLLGNHGKSFAFDSRGTGYGRGEGCGMILLKPLDQALKDNDCVRAVISASGVNQDGYTPGITMPSGESQEALVRKIYRDAGLDPALTGYVEAHGTGTRVGDPIEVTALHNVFNEGRTPRSPLFLGSVKSNIGHLESASGILAVIKTAVGLDRGFVLPNYDFKQGNPKIPFAEWGLKVPIRQMPWPRGKRFASVNNFGFGGTNAHIVMERAPFLGSDDDSALDKKKEDPTKKLFVLTAADKATCQTVVSNLGVYLEQRPEMFQRDLMANVAYTLGQRRSLLSWRVAVPAKESFELTAKISKGGIVPVKETGSHRIGFVCTGQGAQWWAMGRELYAQYPVFAQILDQASDILTQLGSPYNLIDELSLEEKTTRVNQAHISQPACTAIQLALIGLLRSWNIVPHAVIGHSSGEIAAAYAAGILSVESAMRIAYHRGRLVPVLKERHLDLQGSMLAIGCGKDEVDPFLNNLTQKEARIACYNSPQSLTISGDTPAINELSQILEDHQIFNRKLVIETAYHSHHMELIAKDYLNSIHHLPAPNQKSRARFFSSLTGKEANSSQLNSNYWVSNLTSPVKFAQALTHLVAPSDDYSTGVDLLLEIGPHSALQGPIKQTLKTVGGAAEKIPYAATLSRKKNAVDTILDLAATLFCKGAPLDLASVNFPKTTKTPSLLTDLPTYPWNHSNTYWHESRIAKLHKRREAPRHDILGTLANYSNDLEPTWRNIIRLDDVPWLRHHKIQTLTIFPISAFVGIAIEAASQQAKSKDIDVGEFELKDVDVHTPLMIPADESIELTITLRSPQAADVSVTRITSNFLIHTYSASKGWTKNCSGVVTVKTSEINEVDGQTQSQLKTASLAQSKSTIEAITTAVEHTDIYNALEESGVSYGPTFQGLEECRADGKHAVAKIIVRDTATDMPEHFETEHIIHPSFLEQLVQMYWPILGAGRDAVNTVCLPSSIERLTVSPKVLEHAATPGQSLKAYATAAGVFSAVKPNHVSMFAVADDEVLIEIDNLTVAPLPATDVDSEAQAARELCYKQIWEPILEPLQLNAQNTDDSSQVATQIPSTSGVVIIHSSSAAQEEIAQKLSIAIKGFTEAEVELGTLTSLNYTDKHIICVAELDEFILSTLNPEQMSSLQNLIQTARDLLWITRGAYGQKGDPTGNMVSGFSRAIRSENMFMFSTLDLDAVNRLDDTGTIQAVIRIFKHILGASGIANTEMEFQERKGEFWTPRVVSDDIVNQQVHKTIRPPAVEDTQFGADDRALSLAITTPGIFESLHFVDDERRAHKLAGGEIEIEVKAVALNARDVETAAGHTDASHFGQYFSGLVTRVGTEVRGFSIGDRVAAVADGALATYARTNADFAFKVGPETSFETAASLTSAYLSAHYGLVNLAQLEDQETILVLNGAGAVGQAAISLAQNLGATVLATVENAEDKKVLLHNYEIPEQNIFYSKDDQLSTSILRATNNRGVDVVFSIQATLESIQHALKTLTEFGRLVREETSERSSNGKLNLSGLSSNTSLFSYDFHSLATRKPRTVRRLINDVSRSLKQGRLNAVQALNVLPISEVVQAFKLARAAPASSKIVIVPHSEDLVKTTPSKQVNKLFKEDATYILIGGTGGLGRGMTRWMAAKGAKHVVLLSRSGSVTGAVKTLVDDLASVGVNVVVHSCDVAKREAVDALLQKLTALPPIRGVIHGAMILRDRLFEKMEIKDWTEVIESKVQGAWNFHNALLSTPLDFFICYSSSAAAMGGRGQAAYASANSFLDALAQHRRSLGLPGASLGPTAVIDSGFLFENSQMMDDVVRNIGDNYITEAEVLSLLECILNGISDQSCNSHIITGVKLDPANLQFWAADAKYKHLRIAAEAIAASLNDGTKSVSWSAAFKSAETLPDAEHVACDGLVEKIAKTLGLELEEVDPNRNLSNYALDSLTAIDVRNFITREFDATMQVLELLASGTIQTLAKAVCAKSKALKFVG